MNPRTLFAAILCALSMTCLWSGSAVNAFAADWSFTPSATLSQAYDSNFRFLATPVRGATRGDSITTLSPVLSVTGATETTTLQFDTVTAGQAYFKNPKFDTVNTNTTASLTEQWSPRFSTVASVGLIHDTTLEDQLLTSGIVSQKTERYLFNFGLSGKYALSESLNLIASGVFAKAIYPSGTLPGSDVYQATITPVWAVSARDNIGLSSNYAHTGYSSYANGNAVVVETLTEMLYWERLWTETLTCKLSGGYYSSNVDYSVRALEVIPKPPYLVPVNLPVTTQSGNPAFGADLKKDWSEQLSTTLSAGRQQYNDAIGRAFNSTFISGTASYKLSELTTVSLLARYNTNSQAAQAIEQIDYYIISPSIERYLTENLVVRLSGSYEYESQTNPVINLDRYRTWVDITYKWPRFLASY